MLLLTGWLLNCIKLWTLPKKNKIVVVIKCVIKAEGCSAWKHYTFTLLSRLHKYYLFIRIHVYNCSLIAIVTSRHVSFCHRCYTTKWVQIKSLLASIWWMCICNVSFHSACHIFSPCTHSSKDPDALFMICREIANLITNQAQHTKSTGT